MQKKCAWMWKQFLNKLSYCFALLLKKIFTLGYMFCQIVSPWSSLVKFIIFPTVTAFKAETQIEKMSLLHFFIFRVDAGGRGVNSE